MRHCNIDLNLPWPDFCETKPACTQGQKNPSKQSEKSEQQSQKPVFQ